MSNSSTAYSDAQLDYIKDLLDKLGYRQSPLKDEVVEYLTETYCTSLSNTSDVIDWLQEQLQLRRNARPNTTSRDTVTASGLAEYTFCPASYSIYRTFRVPPTVKMLSGKRGHEGKELVSYLQNVRKKRERQYFRLDSDEYSDQEEFVLRGAHGRLLESDLVHIGHASNNNGPFYGPDGEIVGNPDYVYEHPDGTLIIVEEKHTSHSDASGFPFDNHVVQLAAYLHIFATYDVDLQGCIVYFRDDDHPVLRRVKDSEENRAALQATLNDLKELREDRTQAFAPENAHPNKCIGCSVNAYCNHKSRLKDTLEVPYRMVRTADLP